MIEISLQELQDGDVLAKSIVGVNGITILGKGARLTPYYIKRLGERGIAKVCIEQSSEEKFAPKPRKPDFPVHPAKHRELMFKTVMERAGGMLANSVELSVEQKARFDRIMRQTMADILAEPQVVKMLQTLREYDPSLFEHSLNVAVWSGLTGMNSGFNSAQMLELTLGALLFDMGMTQLPVGIVRNGRMLTPDERLNLERHPAIGYQLLLQVPNMPISSAECALQHHERFNGTGYPYRFGGNRLSEYAQIVAIADTFNALISARSYRDAHKVQEAIEFMFASGNYLFDAELVRRFLKPITAYPISSILMLSNGQIGVVSSYSTAILHRPVVQIIREASGSTVITPYELDLANTRNVTVVSCTD